MTDVTTCPECGGDTKHEWTENKWNIEVRHIRTCGECRVEFVVSYGRPEIVEVDKHD
jgi:hypothetical protein